MGFSDWDFFIGLILPILCAGIALGWVIFIGIPWLWTYCMYLFT